MATLGVSLVVGVSVIAMPAAAQTQGSGCGETLPEFEELVVLLDQIQRIVVAVGLATAAVTYSVAGWYWIRGTTEAQQKAKRFFWNTCIGVMIILLSNGFVSFIQSVLGCPGGLS